MVNATASYSPKIFSFECSKLLLDLRLADNRILCFWYVPKSIHKCIMELHVLQCLFVRGSNKKQRRCRIISNFTKGENFSSLMKTKYSCGQSHKVVPLLAHSPLQFRQEESIPGHSIERRVYWFVLKIPGFSFYLEQE